MNRIRIALSLVVIITLVAAVGGATMAWFASSTDPINNEFTAGTVAIEAGWQSGFAKLVDENWNPGDCSDLGVCVVNEGTKAVKLRAQFNGYWTPGRQRMLVIYKNNTTQLLSIDWDAFCKGATGGEGPIAEGNINLQYPYDLAYFRGEFNSFSYLKDPDWLSTGKVYSVWCTDSQTTISPGNHDVKIFDPFSNPDWFDEVPTKPKWEQIPWHKLDYIINQNFLEQGYTSNNIQDAIWHFTNGSIAPFHTPYIYANLNAKAKEIVDDVNANSGLQPSNVSFSPGAGWSDGGDGWWYYEGVLPGTYTTPGAEDRKVCVSFSVCLDGATTGNEYQGAHYHLISLFQAIQASHEGEDDGWQWSVFDTYK